MIGVNSTWSLWGSWDKFLQQDSKKGISRDTWMMLLSFMETVPTADKVGEIDPFDAWPILIDEFVDYLKEN
jgi:DCN1-like protein 1/2